MSNLVQSNAIESVIIRGDLSQLTADQSVSYYKSVCESVGLNPLTKPFEYIVLSGKKVLYATRGCTDQLRKIHSVSISISSREKHEDIYVVTVKAKDKSGREDESSGAVNLSGLKGDALANALMKAETKAKRRVTLSVCGLGMLDESEIHTIEDAKPAVDNPFFEEKFETELLSHHPGEYVLTFGKFKGKSLKDINAHELDSYCNFITDTAAKEGKEIRGQVKEALEFAEVYLKSLEFVR